MMEDPELSYEENSDESEVVSDEEETTDDADSGIDDERDDDSNADADDERFGGAPPPPKKKAKLSKTELYKPPTSDEINQLKETENLFQSSLLRMQVGAVSYYRQSHRFSCRLKTVFNHIHSTNDLFTLAYSGTGTGTGTGNSIIGNNGVPVSV